MIKSLWDKFRALSQKMAEQADGRPAKGARRGKGHGNPKFVDELENRTLPSAWNLTGGGTWTHGAGGNPATLPDGSGAVTHADVKTTSSSTGDVPDATAVKAGPTSFNEPRNDALSS